MTDYSDLVQRLRSPIKHPQQLIAASHEAANTIEYLAAEEDHLWTKINKMTVVIKLMDARIEELEASIKPFAAYYVADCTNLDPDYCVICEADEEENNLTVGMFRAAHESFKDN